MEGDDVLLRLLRILDFCVLDGSVAHLGPQRHLLRVGLPHRY